MSESLPSRYQNNASRAAHIFVYNLIRQMGATNMQAFLVDMGPSFPAQLLGYNAYMSSAITNVGGTTGRSAATASNDDILVLGDWSAFYCIVTGSAERSSSTRWCAARTAGRPARRRSRTTGESAVEP
jgi:predicted phage gp36 major capsid-like protein